MTKTILKYTKWRRKSDLNTRYLDSSAPVTDADLSNASLKPDPSICEINSNAST